MPNVKPAPVTLQRRLAAEAVGTGLLVTVVVGSGIAAQQLSSGNTGLQLLENSTATVFGLAVLILMFGPVSGAHFNPVVTAVDWLLGRRSGTGISGAHVTPYIAAQTFGAVAGAMVANAMFDLPVVEISATDRAGAGHGIGEIVATAGLVALIFLLARTGRRALSAAAVGAYIGAAYWFTSSTSFANPAVTIGRIFTDTFAGIAPGSVPLYIGAQIIGAAVGLGLVIALYSATDRPPDPEDATVAGVGARLGAHGAITVDQQMRTTLPGVFAAGDCATTHHRMLGPGNWLPLGAIAHKQGLVAGENATGGHRVFPGSLGTQVVKVFDLVAARTGLREAEASTADRGWQPVTTTTVADDHKAYYPGATPITLAVTGDQITGRLLGAQLIGRRGAEIAKRVDTFPAALFTELPVDQISDLDLSYTPPLGSPYDAVQIAAQAWTAQHQPVGPYRERNQSADKEDPT